MPNVPTQHAAHEQRVLASYRTRACAAGLCTGAQIYLAGCACGMPLALCSVWLAALAAMLLSAWFTVRSCRVLMHPLKSHRFSRHGFAVLSAALFASGAFSCASMVCYASQTLVTQTRGVWIAAMAGSASVLCALSGGTGTARLCFALRYAFPVLLLGLSVSSLHMPVGLFPILGAGADKLGIATVSMLFAAAPALMLALPPPELAHSGQAAASCIPKTSFFVRRVLFGALAGTALLFLSSTSATYESIAGSAQWGARLRMAADSSAREGVMHMLLTLTKLLAMLLLSANMLCAAEQALVLAFPILSNRRTGLLILSVLLFACLAALIMLGEKALLAAAPALILLAMPAAWVLGRRRRE